jgi:hypothetical protein
MFQANKWANTCFAPGSPHTSHRMAALWLKNALPDPLEPAVGAREKKIW